MNRARSELQIQRYFDARHDPIVRQLHVIRMSQKVPMVDLASKAGVGTDCLSKWGRVTDPRLSHIEACFNALGYTLKAVPLQDL